MFDEQMFQTQQSLKDNNEGNSFAHVARPNHFVLTEVFQMVIVIVFVRLQGQFVGFAVNRVIKLSFMKILFVLHHVRMLVLFVMKS